jgi:hypothetical protein
MLTDKQIKDRLKEHEWAEHVWKGGREYLLDTWKSVVENVEKGYDSDFMVEEYWNDLDVREAIQLVELDNEVKDLDTRFRNSITHPDINIRNYDNNDFWNYGYPKKARGHFLEGIQEYIEHKK